jgi:nucleoside-diphosphate-sugar epimerase
MPENPSTVLVTGAFGQVGRRLTSLLLDRGSTVVAMDVRTDATEATARILAPESGRGRLVPAFINLVDRQAVGDLIAEHRPQAIVHLAAVLAPACYRDPALAHRVNVDGTTNLVSAAKSLDTPPFFVEASSSAVYGSRNPFRHADRLSADTPVNPVDCYGEDKVAAEGIVAACGLPHATLRLGGVMSPDSLQTTSDEGKVLSRAVPGDNRIHMVDARDVALAFANAVDRASDIDGKTLMIAGDDTCRMRQQQMMDDVMEALGIGRIGASTSLPGDPGDDRGWFLTDWFDTTEAQALLNFQHHSWRQTLDDLAESFGRRRLVNRLAGPILRPLIRRSAAVQRKRDGRGKYADPWSLIGKEYGTAALASTVR